MTEKPNPNENFWKYYMYEHRDARNRLLHVIGTSIGVPLVLYFLVFDIKNVWIGLVFAYGFAWTGHFVFEKNRPATFRYPFQSLYSDLKMTYLTLSKPFRQKN